MIKSFASKLLCIPLTYIWGCSLVLAKTELLADDMPINKPSDSQKVEMVAGLAKPPFIIEPGQSGLQIEIIQAAFETENIATHFTHLPLGRNITGYQQWHVDGIATLPVNYQYPGLYMSQPYIEYENVAVSLSDKNIDINSVEDLSGKSVIAFQNARKFLPKSYESVVAYSLDYREIADQQQQIAMLFAGRTEVIILDINIFLYFVKTQTDGVYSKLFDIHHIFDKRYYAAGFKSKALADSFDRGIELIKDNGTYQYLLDKYLYQLN